MATARIVVNPEKSASKQMLKAISGILIGISELRRVVAAQEMMVNGETVTGTQAALEYGVADAATGAAIWSICSAARDALAVAAVGGLSKLDQG